MFPPYLHGIFLHCYNAEQGFPSHNHSFSYLTTSMSWRYIIEGHDFKLIIRGVMVCLRGHGPMQQFCKCSLQWSYYVPHTIRDTTQQKLLLGQNGQIWGPFPKLHYYKPAQCEAQAFPHKRTENTENEHTEIESETTFNYVFTIECYNTHTFHSYLSAIFVQIRIHYIHDLQTISVLYM